MGEQMLHTQMEGIHCALTQPELCYFLVTLMKMHPGQAWPADGGNENSQLIGNVWLKEMLENTWSIVFEDGPIIHQALNWDLQPKRRISFYFYLPSGGLLAYITIGKYNCSVSQVQK